MITDLERVYNPADSVTFRKTDEPFGGLSNMAPGFRVRVNGILMLTVEALYQACRFPHIPELQKFIISQRSPMTLKMRIKRHTTESRPDWELVRVKIMKWCLRVKLAQNFNRFGSLLLETGERPIVEDSRKDAFWGAVQNATGQLIGANVLGRLLMELREELKKPDSPRLLQVDPPPIPELFLLGDPIRPIGNVDKRDFSTDQISISWKSVASKLTIEKASVDEEWAEAVKKLVVSLARSPSKIDASIEIKSRDNESAETIQEIECLLRELKIRYRVR